MDRYATTFDVARRYGVTVDTVRAWVRQNRIPHIRVTKRTIRFDIKAIEMAMTQSEMQKAGHRHGFDS